MTSSWKPESLTVFVTALTILVSLCAMRYWAGLFLCQTGSVWSVSIGSGSTEKSSVQLPYCVSCECVLGGGVGGGGCGCGWVGGGGGSDWGWGRGVALPCWSLVLGPLIKLIWFDERRLCCITMPHTISFMHLNSFMKTITISVQDWWNNNVKLKSILG